MPRAINGRKICSKCRIEKSVEEYSLSKDKVDGLQCWCKGCKSNNYLSNKEYIALRQRAYREPRRKEISAKQRAYNKAHPGQQAAQKRERRHTDPTYRLKTNIRKLIGMSFINYAFSKKSKASRILGCSFEEFCSYLRSRFYSNMSIENHGEVWEMDHIIPLEMAQTEEEMIKLNHHTNLQPLTVEDHRMKTAKEAAERAEKRKLLRKELQCQSHQLT